MNASRSIVLVGLMGTGKTTLCRLVAQRLGRRCVDTDELIIERTGRTVREIFLADGEDAFRALETDVLRGSLDGDEPVVLAAAGGVVLAAANRRALRDSGAFVVWLQAAPEALVERVATQGHRPLLDADPLGTLRTMAADRAPLYREVASAAVDAERPPEQIADWIVRRFERATAADPATGGQR